MIPLEKYFSSICELRGEELSAEDEEKIGTAYKLAEKYHRGQIRASGESYFEAHCIPVSLKVAGLQLSSDMIAAALLHDTLEDTALTYEELAYQLGDEIAYIVDGVSKLSKVKYRGGDRHAESLRKFFVATAKDLRVVLLKLCDRWHNLETLEHLPEAKRQRIARESILIHAQLATRLNMGQVATHIKDLAFPYAYPEEYRKTISTIGKSLTDANTVVDELVSQLHTELQKSLGYQPMIDKRVKGLFSTYQKLERKNWNIDAVHDLVAMRVIVKTVEECYRVLGILHSFWPPLPGRFKDYISLAKPNGYRSLHTVIVTNKGINVEVQIRTETMHEYNEYGVAAHHMYKTVSNNDERPTFSWINQLSQLNDADVPADEFLGLLSTDFFETRIFALTPKGDVIDLPQNATALDFAYAIHSDIGDHAMGARINGVFTKLESTIPSEATVEIITSPKSKPTKKWLDFAVTSQARSKINRYLRESS